MGIERSIFDWEGWDGDQEILTFTDCTLKIPVGPFTAGAKISAISLLLSKSQMELYNPEGEVLHSCKVKLVLDGDPFVDGIFNKKPYVEPAPTFTSEVVKGNCHIVLVKGEHIESITLPNTTLAVQWLITQGNVNIGKLREFIEG